MPFSKYNENNNKNKKLVKLKQEINYNIQIKSINNSK